VQAHKNRIHVLKAHHTQTSSHKQLAKIEKEINKLEHHLLRDQRRLFGTPRTLLDRKAVTPRLSRVCPAFVPGGLGSRHDALGANIVTTRRRRSIRSRIVERTMCPSRTSSW
jgi:hypothetical protein